LPILVCAADFPQPEEPDPSFVKSNVVDPTGFCASDAALLALTVAGGAEVVLPPLFATFVSLPELAPIFFFELFRLPNRAAFPTFFAAAFLASEAGAAVVFGAVCFEPC